MSFLPEDIPKASHLMMNHKFKQAEEILKKTSSFCPVSLYLIGEITHIKSWSTQNRMDKELTITIEKTARTMCETILNDKSGTKLTVYISKRTKRAPDLITKKEILNWKLFLQIVVYDILLTVAVNQLILKQFVSAAWNMRKSWTGYRSIMNDYLNNGKKKGELYPEVEDSLKMGLGIFYYVVSLIPGVSQKILTYFGFKGDRDEGIKFLKENLDHKSMKSGYAGLFLIANYIFLSCVFIDYSENLKTVKFIIADINKLYPDGAVFNYLSAQYEKKIGNVNRASELTIKCLKNCEVVGIEPKLFRWDLANTSLLTYDFEEAKRLYEKVVVSGKENFEYTSLCSLQLACIHEIQEKPDKAKPLLDSLKSYIKHNGRFDQMSFDRSQSLKGIKKKDFKKLVAHIFLYELLYFRRDLRYMDKKELIQLQKTFQGYINNHLKIGKKMVNNIVGAYVIDGAFYIGLGKSKEAIARFEKVLSLSKFVNQASKHWLVTASFELAEIYFNLKDYKTSAKYLKQSTGYTNYCWYDLLNSKFYQATSLLKKVQKEQKQKQKKK